MAPRKRISRSDQTQILVESRRRCCICFGLHRDEEIKKGQIAHLDGDRTNDSPGNLVFLCLAHHDEYDSRTSQSKNFTKDEVIHYRKELYDHFGVWAVRPNQNELLNFLASQIGIDEMAEAAARIGSQVVFYGELLAFDVLTTDQVDYCDGDLYIPHLYCADHFASWGWLTYTEEEKNVDGVLPRVFITAQRKPICDEVAGRILKNVQEQEKNGCPQETRSFSSDDFLSHAARVGWKPPN